MSYLAKVSDLMGVGTEAITHAFCCKVFQACGAAPVDMPLSGKKASGRRDAMAKSVYGQSIQVGYQFCYVASQGVSARKYCAKRGCRIHRSGHHTKGRARLSEYH